MKPTQDFTSQNLLLMKGRKISSSLRRDAPKALDDWIKLCKELEEQIALGTFRFEGLFISSTSTKPALATSRTADALVLRKINDNIRRAYGIRQVQRNEAVSTARTVLGEWTPKGIVSVDLKSCFETITPSNVLEKLTRDAKVSTQTINLLELIFKQAQSFGRNKYSKGLPRGILISSTLAELFLKSLDRRIESINGVYLYIRYVDDLLIVCAKQSAEVFSEILKAVADEGLSVNSSKSQHKDAGCLCSFKCDHPLGHCPCGGNNKCSCVVTADGYDHIDYLGYRLIFKTGRSLKETGPCYALISPSKIKKIKTRIHTAFSDFRDNRDLSLLSDRIRYLTTNIKIDGSLKSSCLRSGIAYTYQQYRQPPDTDRFNSNSLSELDAYLQTKIRVAARLFGFTYMQKRALRVNSYSGGHGNKHRSSFTKARLVKVKECWANVGR